MNFKLDGFEKERVMIQDRFMNMIDNGLNDAFIEYYKQNYWDETRQGCMINRNSFGLSVSGKEYSTNINMLIKDNKVIPILNEETVQFSLFKEGTTEQIGYGAAKYSTYYRIYTYILKFCDLTMEEFIYLYKFAEVNTGAFYLYPGLSKYSGRELFEREIADSPCITKDMLLWLKLNG